MPETECPNCGGTDFTETSGFFVCSNCYTQSQDIVVQAFDDEGIGANVFNRSQEHDEDRSIVQSCATVAEDNFTSWECYNIVLKGLIEELIKLGASSQLKIVAFQLWATYLKRAGIAFISKKPEKMPALPFGFKIKDAKILHDVDNLRKVLLKQLLEEKSATETEFVHDDMSDVSSTTSNATRRSLKLKQRKMILAEAKATADGISESVSQSVVDELLSNSVSRPKRAGVKFNKRAEPLFEKIKKNIKSVKRLKDNERDVKKLKRSITEQMYNSKNCPKLDGNTLYNAPTNMVVLVSIIRVALLLLEDDILLDDILRWICDGKLSANRPEKFVPDFDLHVKKHDLLSVNRNGFQRSIKNFTLNMDLCDIPTPNLLKLAERYCTDFYLPKEFTRLIMKIIHISEPKMDYSRYKFISFPDYECRVMAFILYGFKFLFSLDDFTEYQQSDFANAVNERIQHTNNSQIRTLFSWSKWVRYIECRKAVLSMFNPALNQLMYNDRVDNENVFFDYWERVKPSYVIRSKKAMNEFVLNAMKNEIHDMRVKFANFCPSSNIDFPVSLTPYASSVEYLLNEKADLLPGRCREILREDYSDMNVEFAMDTDFCYSLAAKFDLKVERNEKRQQTVNYYEYSPSELLEFSRTIMPTVTLLADVTVEKDSARRKRQNRIQKCKKRSPPITLLKSNDTDKKRKFSILNPMSQYWVFHEFYKKITVEDFESISNENFPKSFLWLLDECVTRLRTDRKTLYSELVFVEAMLCMTNADHMYDKQITMRINKQEW